MSLYRVKSQAALQLTGESGMQSGEVVVHEANFHVADLHLNLLENVAVLEVLEVLHAHVEG